MGGYGSGRWGWHDKKTTAEECRQIDVGRFKREGMLLADQTWAGSWWWKNSEGKQTASVDVTSCAEWVQLSYTITYTAGDREPEKINYTIPVAWTPCNFGGQRPWFICPGQNCGRRVGKLYFPCYALSKYYLCRHCYDLAYTSQRENVVGRLFEKAWSIRRRLGGEAGLAYPFPSKPARMHWQKYLQLRGRHDEALSRAMNLDLVRLGQTISRVDRLLQHSK